jgi:zinc-binding alcohol dehydrogenase family protein
VHACVGSGRHWADALVTIAYPPEKPPQDCCCWVKPLIMRPSPVQLARIANLVASGAVCVEIAEEFELADVRRAHALSESGHARKDRSYRPGLVQDLQPIAPIVGDE